MPNLPGLSGTQADLPSGRRKLADGAALNDGGNTRMPGLRPAAAPTDTYARPAQAPINNNLRSLAEGLSMLNPALQGYADQLAAKEKQGAPDAVAKLTAGKSADEVQAMLKSGQHPVLNSAANKELVGNVYASRQGDEDAAFLTKWHSTEYDRTKGDLQNHLNEFVAKRVQQLGPNTPGAHAYMERMSAFSRSLMQQDTKDQVAQTQFQQAQTVQDGVLTIANSAIDAGETQERLVGNLNNFFQTNKVVTGKPYAEQVKIAVDSLDPLIQRMEREPGKRDAIFGAFEALATLPRKGEDGVERRLIDAPNGVGEMVQKKLVEFKKKRDQLNDQYLVSETADMNYKAHNRPQDITPEQIEAFDKAHPGALKTGEKQGLLVARMKALDVAAKANADYEAERAVGEARANVTSQDYQRFKDFDFIDAGDAKVPTKKMILSGGQIEDTSTFSGNDRRQAVVDAFRKDLDFQKNQLVNTGKATPDAAERWAEGQELAIFSQNGMVPADWKQSLESGMHQITTAVSTGKAMPSAAVRAYERFKLVQSQAPNILNDIADPDTRTFFGVAAAFDGDTADQLRAAAMYWAKRDEEREKIKKSDITKAIAAMEPWKVTRFIQRGFGMDVPENMGRMQNVIFQRASILATAYGFSPEKAVEKAARAARNNFAIVNGWAVDTNDKRLPPDFEKQAEKYIDTVVERLGVERFGVKTAKELTLTSMPDGSFMLINKRHGYPVEGAAILEGPNGENFDAKFLTPSVLDAFVKDQRKKLELAAVKEGEDRLKPLFVLPGTRLGMSRIDLSGYQPGEMEMIQKNIDEAAKPKGSNKDVIGTINENAEAARKAEDEAFKQRQWLKPLPLKESIQLRDSKRQDR